MVILTQCDLLITFSHKNKLTTVLPSLFQKLFHLPLKNLLEIITKDKQNKQICAKTDCDLRSF